MRTAIEKFNEQFRFQPEIIGRVPSTTQWLITGMGGSHLAADLLKAWDPELDIVIHSNYGLPALPEDTLRQRLAIVSSYSGNTEETIDSLELALQKKLAIVVVTTGGKLREIATEEQLPYIQLPSTGIQPRAALGYSLMAFLKAMSHERGLIEAQSLASRLHPLDHEAEGGALAAHLKDKIPLIYTSERNRALGYNWKIKFNETGKIPAFYNVLPELNHNEMTGFERSPSTRHLSDIFQPIFLLDATDHPRIQKRFAILDKLYSESGMSVISYTLSGTTPFEKIFSSLLLADWAAFHAATSYGLDPEQVPMVETFKHLLK